VKQESVFYGLNNSNLIPMTVRLLIAILFFTLPHLVSAQNLYEAVIIDSEDKSPIAYATIIYPEQQYGFSANANGYFRIRFSQVEKFKKINISSIGYEQFEGVLGEMYDQNLDTIVLQPKITFLKEILVKAETVAPKEMIANTSDNLKTFLGKEPYYTHVFYTETIKKNDKYAGFAEAQGMMHVSGYQPAYNRKNELFAYDLAQWKHLRRVQYLVPSCLNKKRALSIGKLSKAKARYLYNGPLTKNNLDDYMYTMDSLTTFNNTDVFIIGFRSLERDIRGKIFVKTDDYALIALSVTEGNASDTFDDDCQLPQATDFLTTFTQIGKQYFFNAMELTITYETENSTIQEKLKLRSGEFDNNRTQDLNYDQRLVVFNEMVNPSVTYDPNYWQDQEKVPDGLIADLANNVPIEDQFKYNSYKRPIPLPDNFANYEELYKNQDMFLLFVNDEF